MIIKIGTRGSLLALAQTNIVIDKLKKAFPEHEYQAVVIKTTGDRDLNRPLDQIGSKGLFVDEIERALLADEIQLAVHSMKDMPDNPLEGLVFSKPVKRADPRDVLILKEGNSLSDLPYGANVATGSKRRSFQLLKMRPDLHILPIRGNIDTRIRKLKEGLEDGTRLDGIIIAAAGIERLGLAVEHTYYFDETEMIPAPAQGTIAIEVAARNTTMLDMLNSISDSYTNEITEVERGFLKAIGGDCHLPVGAYATKDSSGYKLYALFGNEDGTKLASTVACEASIDLVIEKAVSAIHEMLEES